MTEHVNYSKAVRNLQQYLRQLSYEEQTIPAPPLDGIFESQTEDALREYQRLSQFAVTGRADRATWDQLYRDYRASLARNTLPRMIHVFSPYPFDDTIRRGRQDFSVLALQYMLLELQRYFLELSEIQMTGIYDDQTITAVKLFQSRNQIPENEEVDLLTWNSIADLYNILHLEGNRE